MKKVRKPPLSPSLLVPWTLATVLLLSTTVLGITVIAKSNQLVPVVLDFTAKLLAPIGAALIAWAGVSLTIANVQRQDRIKEWHSDLRWAVELSTSGNGPAIEAGTHVLEAISDHAYLSPEQNALINAVLKSGFAGYPLDSEIRSENDGSPAS